VPEEVANSNKIKRVITGWIVGVFSLACLCFGGVPLLLFLLAIMFFGVQEYVKILEPKGFYPSFTVIFTACIAFSLIIFFHRFDLLPSIVTMATIVSFLVILFRGRQPYIANVATTTLGCMYAGWLATHVLLLRQVGSDSANIFSINLNTGLFLLIFLFFIVLATDIGAYYFGRKIGKTPLAPVISPKKTVEGAVAGGLLAVLVSATGIIFHKYLQLTLAQCLISGVLITVAAQLGDLSESLLKRDAGVKDSSDFLPGHGGFLDRADSYIFSIPVAYYYFQNFTLGNNILLDFIEYTKGLLHAYF
jgi:phosphatidate cytidylyltransferase